MSKGSSGSKPAIRSIRRKILLAMGTVLALFTLVTGYCLYSVTLLPHAGTAQPEAKSRSALTLQKMTALMQEAQASARQFASQHSADTVSSHTRANEALLEQAGMLEQEARQNNDSGGIQTAERLTGLISQYESSFQELVNAWETRGLTENDGLLGTFNTASLALDDLSASPEPDGLEQGLAAMSKAEEEYLRTAANESLRQLENAVDIFLNAVEQSRIDDQRKQALQRSGKEYLTALNRYQAVSLATSDPSLSAAFSGEMQRQAETMRHAAQGMAQTITELHASRADSNIGTLREQEKKYLLQSSDDNAALVLAALDEHTLALNDAAPGKDRSADDIAALSEYKDAFNALVAQDRVIADRTAKLDASFSVLDREIKNLASGTAAVKGGGDTILSIIAKNNISIIAGAVLAVILIGLATALSLAGSITSALRQLTETARKITAERDPDISFPAYRKDEFGALAAELNTLLEQQGPSPGTVTKVAGNFTESARELLGHIRERIGNDDEIAAVSADQAALAAELNDSIARLTTLSESLVQTGNQFSSQSRSGPVASTESDSTAENSLQGIRAIAESSGRISESIRITSELAEETGMIALNAAIKASRAGVHGKEFSVVAEELDKLAKRSTESAREISSAMESLEADIAEATRRAENASQVHTGLGDEDTASAGGADAMITDAISLADQIGRMNEQITALNSLNDRFGTLLDGLVQNREAIETAISSLEGDADKMGVQDNGGQETDEKSSAS